MALDIFPRRKAAPATQAEPDSEALPEPSPAAMEQVEAAETAAPRTRRATRSRKTAAAITDDTSESVASNGALAEPPAETPKPTRARRSRAKAEPAPEPEVAEAPGEGDVPLALAETPAEDEKADAPSPAEVIEMLVADAEDAASIDEAAAELLATDDDPQPGGDEAPSRRRRRRGRRGGSGQRDHAENGAGEAPIEASVADSEGPSEALHDGRRERPDDRRPDRREPRPATGADPRVDTLVRAVEQLARQVETLVRAQQDDRGRPRGVPTGAPPARVGVFVDAANIELAADRQRVQLDWGKILQLLTRDRQLVRAMAYSPVHDDPGVSIETQRFVEPFLDNGYKVVTKPLKRFQDGSIKANVDIELALDVVSMLDRLDVVCLVSGDGDFERLVELAQSKGVRVEVVGMGSSVASNLRKAADSFIDLQARLREIRV